METESSRNLHIYFAILLTIILFFVIFWVSAYQSGTESIAKNINTRTSTPVSIMTNAEIIYSIQNDSSKIDFDRWFLITIMPTIWRNFTKLTLVTIPTNLMEWSRVTVSIVEKNGTIKKLLLSRVRNHRITFYTKQAWTFQIMKIDN